MPTYDYQCRACGHEWELFQSMNDSPVKSCPKCKKRGLGPSRDHLLHLQKAGSRHFGDIGLVVGAQDHATLLLDLAEKKTSNGCRMP